MKVSVFKDVIKRTYTSNFKRKLYYKYLEKFGKDDFYTTCKDFYKKCRWLQNEIEIELLKHQVKCRVYICDLCGLYENESAILYIIDDGDKQTKIMSYLPYGNCSCFDWKDDIHLFTNLINDVLESMGFEYEHTFMKNKIINDFSVEILTNDIPYQGDN